MVESERDRLFRERVSKEIDTIVSARSTSRLARAFCWVHYHLLRWKNEPFVFLWVAADETAGEPVGDPIEVTHMTLHDMMPHQARGVMTGKVLLEGLRANAIQVLGFTRLDEMNGRTTIQPRWI